MADLLFDQEYPQSITRDEYDFLSLWPLSGAFLMTPALQVVGDRQICCRRFPDICVGFDLGLRALVMLAGNTDTGASENHHLTYSLPFENWQCHRDSYQRNIPCRDQEQSHFKERH
jgi:hypothetical protein